MRLQYLMTLVLIIGLTACGNTGDHLAKIGDLAITQKQFDTFLKFKRMNVQDETRRGRVLDQYLEREALAEVVSRQSLLDADLVQAELNEFRKEMLISRYFEKFLRDKVTDAAVQNYYTTHAADYQERKVQVAHILIRTNPKMSATEREAKLTVAREAYSRINAGKDFAKIAREYSEDKISAKKGGDLGWIKEGSIDPRFSKRVFELAQGEVSEPFETPFGFHVVKVISSPKTVKRPLTAVSGDIRYQLRALAKKAELERLLGQVEIEKK